MKRVAIFHVDLTRIEGGQKVGISLANSMSEDFDIFLISGMKKNKDIAFKVKDTVTTHFIYTENPRFSQLMTFGIIRLHNYLAKNKIDTLLIIGMTKAILGIMATRFTNIKVIVAEHTSLSNHFYNSLTKKISQKASVKLADKIITLTEIDKENYMKKFSLPSSKVDYIYNFIDDDILKYSHNYFYSSNKTILTVGRFDKVKGYERIIDIGITLFKNHPDWQWHIYGGGDSHYIAVIQQLIDENNLSKNIIIRDEDTEILKKYKDYGIYALTSHYEGLPMVLLEAKANHLPIVSFDCETGPSEIIQQQKNGVLISQNNIEEFSKALSYLIVHPSIRENFSKHANDNISKFDKAKIIEKWIQLIESI